ncbi:hypothetical protein [Butyrivibrio fibrisolvens]|jgi:hypothetical protein|uniref:Uncharacterized protein n=1 Tax=Butyrivibrio fibrisolvens TaxID=831 RepID=A0A317G1K7_BUTFI|nr:hypothetical protein [Butyrivibrio fibrisolvens]PWT27778.1 hypothetical protein CPT75_12065 [Butyrivibrio fibrisolvens]
MVDIPIEVQLRPFILLLLILSIVNMVILFNKTNENIGNKREVRAFRGMLFFFIFTLDMFKILGSDADIDIRVFCISRKKDLNKI